MQKQRLYDEVVITGFKTFGSHTKNPTEELVVGLTEADQKAHHITRKFALDVTCSEVDCFANQLKQELAKI